MLSMCYIKYIKTNVAKSNSSHNYFFIQAVKSTEKILDDLGHRAEDASVAASLGAQQLPIKLEGRCREAEHELNRTVQVNDVFSSINQTNLGHDILS